MNIVNIRERQISDVVILDITGNIRIGEGSISVRTAVRQLLKEGQYRILLNLAGVTYIDSSGLGELISGYTSVKKSGGQLKLLHLTERVSELMNITKLYTVFDVYDNESEAVESFSYTTIELEENRPPTITELHHKPDDEDLVPPESPIFAKYKDELRMSHTRYGFAQPPNRSHENTNGLQPPQNELPPAKE